MYKNLPKRNNYHYSIDGDITHLYYQMTEKLFDKHIKYCEENNIIPEIKDRWVDILIDTEDFDRIKGWYIRLSNRHTIKKCSHKFEYWQIYLGKRFGKINKLISLHRFILNPPENLQVDHINHNRFDNRKNMLKIVTNIK